MVEGQQEQPSSGYLELREGIRLMINCVVIFGEIIGYYHLKV